MNQALKEAREALDAAEDALADIEGLLSNARESIEATRGELDRIAEYHIENDERAT